MRKKEISKKSLIGLKTNKMNMNPPKTNYISLLSVISAIAVVVLHTNGIFWNFSNEPYWFGANIIECLFYFAVPIFFMISGITLLNYNERYSTKTFFIKRINKTLIPFLFWSLIGLLYCLLRHTVHLKDLNFVYIINGILNTSFVQIYWFFIPLFLWYAVVPIFAHIDKNKRDFLYLFVVAMFFVINSLIPFLNNVFSLNLNYNLSFNIGGQAFFYALTGYLISKVNFSKKSQIIIAITSFLGLMLHIFGTYYLSVNAGKIVDTYKGYFNVPCILYSLGIFVFIKNISDTVFNNKILNKIVFFLKDYTLAIYLLHWFILDIIVYLAKPDMKYLINRLGLPFIIIPLCILITYVIRKIPILKRILP